MMMRNDETIRKPPTPFDTELHTSEPFDALSSDAVALYLKMMLRARWSCDTKNGAAEFRGCLRDQKGRPLRVRHFRGWIHRLDREGEPKPFSERHIQDVIAELKEAGLIERVEVNGKMHWRIVDFWKRRGEPSKPSSAGAREASTTEITSFGGRTDVGVFDGSEEDDPFMRRGG